MQGLEHWPTDKLIDYARNPRKNDHAVDRVAAAIKEFGFRVPIVAKSDGLIVDGHLRLKAAKKLGLETVPVLLADDLSPAQIKAFRLSVNKMAELAEWDDEMLAVELTDLKDMGFDLDLTGFSTDEIEALLAPTGTEGLTDEDAVPEVPEAPVTVLGDVWLLGKHRVMCGDSTSIDAVEKLMAGGGADMLLTDPPYNVALGVAPVHQSKKTNRRVDGLTIINDDLSDDAFRQLLRDAFTTAATAMKPGAVFYIWHAASEGYNFLGACKDAGLQVRQCLIWKKSALVMGRQDYQWKHEPCLYGWKDGAGHLWASDRKQTTILEFDKPHRNDVHPTMKPVGLFEYQMLNNTKGGDIVLDLFGGSGTTIIAAEKNGRYGYLMELDPKYVDVIVQRWQEFTGQTATLEETGKPFISLKKAA